MNNSFSLKRVFEHGSNSFWKFSIFNVGIRGIGILATFFLHFYLIKHLSLETYGTYGIIYASLIIGVYLLGLDVYVIATRELPKCTEVSDQRNIVFHQCFLYLVSYVVIIPTYIILLSGRFINSKLMIMFAFLLVLEHLTQEFIRVFYALRYVIIANMIILCRRLLWILTFLVITMFNKKVLSVDNLLKFWITGDGLAMVLAIYYGFKIKLFPFPLKKPDMGIAGRMIKSSLVFFGASISLKISNYSGNYFMKYFRDQEDLGIFSIFVNILTLIDVFVYTAVVAIFLPKLIELHHKNDIKEYRELFKRYFWGILLLVGISAAVMAVGIRPGISLIGKSRLLDNLGVFYLLLAGFVLFGLSNIPHFILFVNNKEKNILVSSAAACLINVILNYVLLKEYGLTGSAMAFLASMAFLCGAKVWFARAYLIKRTV